MSKEAAQQINVTLGTAGHIDHGKTALIKLLTGCETDRLKQEKERGMSIELGFAPCQLGDLEVGIVDVPGHENFIKTMVAGATGIDGVIFVVAADDSIMPQTREHLDILTLLGVRFGMVAMTKIDLVTPERVEQVTEELQQFLRGTFLQDAPICPMSSITGAGFDGFYTALKDLIAKVKPRDTDGVFRQPVERVFSVKGFGTVVSGIPASGAAHIGDEVVLLPQGTKSRIKAIQVYGRQADQVQSGQCAALSLPQIDTKSVVRGNVVTLTGYFEPARWWLCHLRLLASEIAALKNGAQVKFHTGTSEVSATVYLLDCDIAQPGQSAYVQIRTDHPIIAGPTDHFILRCPSPARTLGGGLVVESLQRRIKRSKPGVLEDVAARTQAVIKPLSFVEYAVAQAPDIAAKANEIAIRTKLPVARVTACLEMLVGQGRVLQIGTGLYMHQDIWTRIATDLLERIARFHQEQPGSPGPEREKLLIEMGLKKPVFDGVVAGLQTQDKLAIRKGRLALPNHTESFAPQVQNLG